MVKKLQTPLMVALSIVILIGQSGCIPSTTPQNIVITEDVIYISGEVVRMTGRVVETDGNVDDHGFYISNNVEFSAPITITLGPKENGLGRFIGEYDMLDINTDYFFRSYANIGGIEVVGQIEEFKSLKPRIDSFVPDNGIEGSLVTITGINFTKGLRVSMDGVDAEILSITNETSIQIKVPPLVDKSSVELSVTVQDTSMVFSNNFNYHFGRWQLETTFFNNLQLYQTMWLNVGDEFIFGLGAEDNLDLNLNIWSLDLINLTWTELIYPGSAARYPFNSNGFWGTGAESKEFSSTQFSPFFWQYSMGSFVMKPFLSFRLFKSVGLHLNGDLFVFGGQIINFSQSNTVYRYKELNSSWEVVTEAPIGITSEYPYFTYNDEAYFLQPDGSIWRYSPVSGQWDIVSYFPDLVREFGAAVTMNGKAYIGLFQNTTGIWEWDMATNIWTEKIALPGGSRDVNTGYFNYGSKLYFFRSKPDGGIFDPDPRMELWSLNPTALK
jgi:IPT/TIG domain